MAESTLILDGIWGRPWRWGRLRRRIVESGGAAEIFRYDCWGRVEFEELGRRLAGEIRQRGGEVNLVGFSMGGLVVRAAHLVDRTLPIRRAVFLNSPLRGSWLAKLLPWPGIRQMRPGSAFMRAIEGAEWTAPTLSVWCPLDLMVIPGTSARWEEAGECVCCWVPAHIWPVYSRRVHERVVEFLKE